MRTFEEVDKELQSRTTEQKRLVKLVEEKNYTEGSESYLLSRIQSLAFAICWCKWFLNGDTEKRTNKSDCVLKRDYETCSFWERNNCECLGCSNYKQTDL